MNDVSATPAAAPAAPAAPPPAAAAAPAAAQTAAPAPGALPPVPAAAPGGEADLPADATLEARVAHWEKRATDLRTKLAERGAVPKDADSYEFKLEGDLAPYGEKLKDDPVFKTMRGAFHKHGLTDKQAGGVVGDVIQALYADGAIDPPFDPLAEARQLFPEETDPAQVKQRLSRELTDTIGWLDGMKAQGGLSERARVAADTILDRAAGLELLRALRSAAAPGGPITAGAPAAAVTSESLAARWADPRMNRDSPKYDPAFAAETDDLYRRHYGTGRA